MQQRQENEELAYLTGGIPPVRMSYKNRKKEEALYNLRELFVASPQSVQDGYDYVTKVSFKMRQFNITSNEVDVDEAL